LIFLNKFFTQKLVLTIFSTSGKLVDICFLQIPQSKLIFGEIADTLPRLSFKTLRNDTFEDITIDSVVCESSATEATMFCQLDDASAEVREE
jgi:hypothetical protein